jgi:hypothetical protein
MDPASAAAASMAAVTECDLRLEEEEDEEKVTGGLL